MRLGIVCSRFNEDITGRMKKAALATAAKLGARVASIVEVPGAFDTPYAVQL
ncbi:TPA: 6,7-dimethyl-8-ribityllumazine synthase, partial [Candidatus Woesearchaeota archaeon]|nr:6,7-dimethyl-8-ribityllumazine synthase [Candidatus Woesearchaeota archaeon]